MAIEVHWFDGKGPEAEPVRAARLVLRDVVSDEVIGVTPEDPGITAKSFALAEHTATGQVYDLRRGDTFEAIGGRFRVLNLRPRKVVLEELASGVVVTLER